MNWQTRKLTKYLFIIYLLALVWIILFKFQWPSSILGTMQNVNLTPYAAPSRINGEIVRSEMILNAIIFIPFGIYLEMLVKKWPFLIKLFGVLLGSCFLEGMQYILAVGATDITDVIQNVLGGFIGLLLYKIYERWINNQHQAHERMNQVALFGTLLMLTAFASFIFIR